MGIMVDELEMAIVDIEKEGGLIMNECCMMAIFQGILDKLPPFENIGLTCSKISLCLMLFSVRVRFFHLLDGAMIYYCHNKTQTKIHLP